MRVTLIVAAAILFVAACGTAPVPTQLSPTRIASAPPVATSTAPAVPTPTSSAHAIQTPRSFGPWPFLRVDNRGGPTLSVRIGGVEVARAICNAIVDVLADRPDVPGLPWAVSVLRDRDGSVMWSGTVANLPSFYLAFGEQAQGVSGIQPLGPAGPRCTKDGSDMAPSPTADVEAALANYQIDYTPLTEAETSRVEVTAGAAIDQVYGFFASAEGLGCEFLGTYLDRSPSSVVTTSRPAYLVQTLQAHKRGPGAENEIHFVDAVTGDLLTSYGEPTTGDSIIGTTCGATL